MRRRVFAALLAVSLAPIGLTQTDPGAVDLSTRLTARAWFNKWWPLSHNADMGFTGDVSKGIAGDTSQAYKDNVALRINIFRRMCGLQPIVLSPTYNAKDQVAAMMMSANDDISHDPPTTWKFYSSVAAEAAMSSDLSIDQAGPQAIVGYMYDWGPWNGGAPHRNAGILPPALNTMGTGDVPKAGSYAAANALWNSDASTGNDAVNHLTALLPWPAKGYIPHFLIPGRWSLYVPDRSNLSPCDLSHATVKMTQDGAPLTLNVMTSESGGILIWTLDGTDEGDSDTKVLSFTYQGETFGWARPDFSNDIVYHVAVDGIRVPHFSASGDELGDGPLYTAQDIVNGHLEYDVIGYNPDLDQIDPSHQSNLSNISTRAIAGTGSSTQIAGFVISGRSARKVLIRAGGPYLSKLGVNNVLDDPVLTLFDGSNPILSNDDWSSDGMEIIAASHAVGALPFADGSKDSAIVATLQPGHVYTAQVSAKGGATGNALVEVWDVDNNTDSSLVNLSTRSFVGSGENIQIGGFILHGPGSRKVLIRAGGPYLTQAGVQNVLEDPVLTVFRGSEQIAQNDDWSSNAADVSPACQAVGAPPFNSSSKDAAIVLILDPDLPYTAQVSGKNGSMGNALVEVFRIP